jgi:prefoldin beta subunit
MTENNTQIKINDLQLFEQNMQNLVSQKQQFSSQLFEIDSALSEIEKTDASYKIIGNIMIKTEKSELKKDLEEQKKIIDIRISTIEKQEKILAEKSSELQKEIMEELQSTQKSKK